MKLKNHPVLFRCAVGLAAIALTLPAQADLVTWLSATDSGLWSSGTAWSTSAQPTLSSTVVLGDATANRTVTYDTTATTGTISTLTLTETSGFLNQLNVSSTSGLVVSNSITLGSTSGTVELRLGGTAGSTVSTGYSYVTASKGVYISDGGLLSLQVTGTKDQGQTKITGNITMNGGMIGVLSGTDLNNASAANISGSLTMTGGTLRIADATNVANSNRLYISTFNISGGVINATTTNGGLCQLLIAGSGTSTIGAGVTVQGTPLAVLATNNITLVNDATGFAALLYRSNPSTLGRSYVKTSVAGGSTYFSDVEFASNTTGTTQLVLASNLTTTSTSLGAMSQGFSGTAIPKFVMDLGGYVFNGTASNSGFTPNNTNTKTQWVLQSTIGGTGAATAGTFAIKQINLSSANVETTIGDLVTILVTGGSAPTINLSGSGGGFSTTSNVVYTGSSASLGANPAIVTTNRLIPNFTVRQGFARLDSDLGQGGTGSTILLGDSSSIGFTNTGVSNAFVGLYINTGTLSSNITCWTSTGGATGNGRTQMYSNVDSVLTGTITMATDNGANTNVATVISAATGKTLTINGQIVCQGTGLADGMIFNTAVSSTIILNNSANDFSKQNAVVICQGWLISATNGALGGARGISLADGGNGISAPVYLLAKGNQTISAPLYLNNGHSGIMVSAYNVGVMDASNVTFSGNITANTYYNTEAAPRNFIVTAADGGTATFTGNLTEAAASGTLASLTNLTKSGNGTVVITNTWSHTGLTTVSAGVLQIGNGTTGALNKTGSAVISNGATLIFNQGNGGSFAGKIANSGVINTVASGTNTLSGDISGAGSLNQTGNGVTVLGGNNNYTGDTTVSAGELDINGNSAGSTIGVSNGATLGGSGVISGTVNVASANINGNGLAMDSAYFTGNSTLGGRSSAVNGYTLTAGTLNVTGSTASAVTVGSGLLKGSGTVGNVALSGTMAGTLTAGAITGAGTITPGNSPGIMTAASVDLSQGMAFKFELTGSNPTYGAGTGNSGNDVLRLTSADPFVGTVATSSNVFDIYLEVSTLTLGQTFLGGIFTDTGSLSAILSGSYNYFVEGDGNGTHTYNGINFYTLAEFDALMSIQVSSTTVDSATFAGGATVNNGNVMEFTVVPEPGTWAMMAGGLGMLAFVQSLRRRKA